MMSFVSFWLNRGASPARVGLGVTTVITMTTLMASVNAALPKISYMKSIDIYLGTCFFLVFGALIEYAMVGYTEKRIQLRKNRFLTVQKMMEERRVEALKQLEYQSALEEDIKIQENASFNRTPTRHDNFNRKVINSTQAFKKQVLSAGRIVQEELETKN